GRVQTLVPVGAVCGLARSHRMDLAGPAQPAGADEPSTCRDVRTRRTGQHTWRRLGGSDMTALLGPGLKRSMRSGAPLFALGLVWLVLQFVMPGRTPLGIVLLGLVIGSLNALFAAGIVLIYKSSRVINFAQG